MAFKVQNDSLGMFRCDTVSIDVPVYLGLTLKKALLQGGDSGQNLSLQLYRDVLFHKAFQCGPIALQSCSVFIISFPSDLRDQLQGSIAQLLNLRGRPCCDDIEIGAHKAALLV